ncbi:PP2C family protein-serine/threonine phosphatase [Sphingomonas crusticola]|uniref:PP2C family protein-serine/threonine phosphatase n=1 Tax=Sphingomonas crusticola TaxID=1697973 RepID=UPI000E228098|nr:fused response regulator/phosphatase [Sphingomonas crusticola]
MNHVALNGPAPLLQRARVLVVDDVEANRDLLVRRLARLGIANVIQAADGQAALDIIRRQPLDLILLDIMMPVVNGFEVLEAMKREGLIERLPVLVVSAMGETDAAIRAIELGAVDFLQKPFNPTLLRVRVLATLEKKRLRDGIRDELARRRAELLEARQLQLALTPPHYSDEWLSVAALIEPAREVGGDLVDHVRLPDGRHLLVVGDVSDKGAAAALMMARTHSLIRSLATGSTAVRSLNDLGAAAHSLNQSLAAGNDGCMFVTLFVALYDPAAGWLDYVRCGHVPPFVHRSVGRMERLELAGGLPLGVSDAATYRAGRIELAAGDTLLVLSDGVTEAAAPDGLLFGEERVEAWLAARPATIAPLVDDVRDHEAGGPPSDDLAILFLTVNSLNSSARKYADS